MHFARLANTLLKDGESARDNHVLASNFAKYLPMQNNNFTDKLSSKPFPSLVINNPTTPSIRSYTTL